MDLNELSYLSIVVIVIYLYLRIFLYNTKWCVKALCPPKTVMYATSFFTLEDVKKIFIEMIQVSYLTTPNITFDRKTT